MSQERHRTAHNRPATVKGVNDMGESMSKAEAVCEIMQLARGGYVAASGGRIADRRACACQAVVRRGKESGSSLRAA